MFEPEYFCISGTCLCCNVRGVRLGVAPLRIDWRKRFARLHEGATTTGVTGYRVHRQWQFRAQQARVDQRADHQNKPLRITTGVGNQRSLSNPATLNGVELGQPITPAIVNAMSGAGVDDSTVAIRQCHCFDGCCVGQAEDRDIRFCESTLAGFRIFAIRRADLLDLNIVTCSQVLGDL